MNLRQQLAADLARRVAGSTAGLERGHGCLMIDNKIFAFTRPDESAALKLPASRIAELIEGGEIRHLVMGERTMREWVVVPDIIAPGNLSLLHEAKAYVTSLPKDERRQPAKKSSKESVKKPMQPVAKTPKRVTKKATKSR
jgi:hypothetical protein